MNNPRITVVIPVYNMKETIGKAIESFLDQSYPNKELMVLDACSTDGTLDVINKYRDKIDYLVSQKDDGPSHAIAENIKYATGDYIALLGADDRYEEGSLQIAADTIERTNADVVYGDCNFIYPNGDIIRKSAAKRGIENLYYYNTIFSNAAFVRKALLENYYKTIWSANRNQIDVATDHLLWLDLYHKKYVFESIDSDKAISFYNATGRSNSNEYRGCIDDIRIIRLVLQGDEEAQKKYMPTFNKYLAARAIIGYEKALGVGNFSEVVKKHINSEDDYIIWGTGDMSRKVVRLIELAEGHIKYFVDNNYKFNTAGYMNKTICSPDVIKKEKNVTVIIGALGNEKNIREQISNMNIDGSVRIEDYADIADRIQEDIGIDKLEKAWENGVLK